MASIHKKRNPTVGSLGASKQEVVLFFWFLSYATGLFQTAISGRLNHSDDVLQRSITETTTAVPAGAGVCGEGVDDGHTVPEMRRCHRLPHMIGDGVDGGSISEDVALVVSAVISHDVVFADFGEQLHPMVLSLLEQPLWVVSRCLSAWHHRGVVIIVLVNDPNRLLALEPR